MQVKQIWPQTTSVFFGYEATNLDRQACATAFGGRSLPAPACDRPFPFYGMSPDQTNVIFGQSRADQALTAVVRGHDPVAAGQVINPREVRELVLIFSNHERAIDNAVTDAVRKCGSPSTGAPDVYRTLVKSQNVDDLMIAGRMEIVDNKLIWLEFDEIGWNEASYQKVADLARSEAGRL
ncbi:hypothetical protein AB0H43_22355 [Hamadaea sp. NPDC050747]|uniref:hypothetical protein n=1 Tax=Hamadaea sp. NPDC050747 TaxID=3155789 RepID=UPI0033C9D81D